MRKSRAPRGARSLLRREQVVYVLRISDGIRNMKKGLSHFDISPSKQYKISCLPRREHII